MGWFENQIEERRAADQQLLEDSFAKVAGVVLGERTAQRLRDERIVTKDAIEEIPRAASLFADEDGQAIQVLWRCNGLAAPFAVRRGDEGQIIRKDGAGYEVRRLDPSFDEGQVQFIFDQELLQLFRVVDGRQDRPVRPRPAAIRQELHQEDVADGDARAQADRQ